MITTGTCSPGRHIDILVMYQSSPSSYGIRLHSSLSDVPHRVASVCATFTDVAFEPQAITCTEYDELAALRKAQAWGTPMFQPEYPRYAEAMARLEHLEAKAGSSKNLPQVAHCGAASRRQMAR
jgi:hypothetical protein